jgi:hypothetical protein
MNSRLLQVAGHFKPTPEGTKLLFGDLQLGYYGQISQAKLITPAELITQLGIVQGSSINPDTSWMKFAYKGKTLFVAKQGIRQNLTHLYLQGRNVVNGSKTIVIQGKTYKVRLMKGGATQNQAGLDGSEWSQLMYRVCTEGPGGLQKWDNIPHAELCKIVPYSTYVTGDFWQTQEYAINGGFGTINETRGRASISASTYLDMGANNTYPWSAWRPVLELVL